MVPKNDRLSTLGTAITNPQAGSVGNARRVPMSENGPSDRCRHMLIGYARVSTADQNPDHQSDTLLRHGVELTHDDSDEKAAPGFPAPSPGQISP